MRFLTLFFFLFFSCSTKQDVNNLSLNIEFKNSNNEEITIEKVKSDYSIELIKPLNTILSIEQVVYITDIPMYNIVNAALYLISICFYNLFYLI